MKDSRTTEQNTPTESDLPSEGKWPRMTKEQINAHPVAKYEGPIRLIKSAEQVARAVK